MGCVGAGLYTTPETAAVGAFHVDTAFEAWRLHREVSPDPIFGRREAQDDGVSLIPTVVGRLGVAVDPLVRLMRTQDGVSGVGELPVLVGLRPSRDVTVVASGGLGVVGLNDDDGSEKKPTRAFARAGLAVEIRVHPRIAIAPEVAVLHGLSGHPMEWLTGGIAFRVEGSK